MASTKVSSTENVVPTPYRISTITFNGDLNVYLRSTVFFQLASIAEDVGLVWMEGWLNGELHTRGVFPKRRPGGKRGAKTSDPVDPPATRNKSFDNQISMYYRFRPDYIPHVKLFKNGNVHITGLRCVEDGMTILELLRDSIQQMVSVDPTVLMDGVSIEALKITNPVIRLINSDFHVPYKIRRKELHQLLIGDPYHTICSFQPGTYPGVKLEYYWNAMNPRKDGRCHCSTPCFGRKNSSCKKVTVAIFDSGSVLITGATSHCQVEDAYQFICKVMMDHRPLLKKTFPVLTPAS